MSFCGQARPGRWSRPPASWWSGLPTDIEGARAAGYDSLFGTRGIFSGELGIAPGEEPDPAQVATLCARYAERPIAAIATFRW